MPTGRRASDWLTNETRDAGGETYGYERRAADRRTGDRRAPRRRIDTLFAASLINQVKPQAEPPPMRPYADANKIRCGILGDYRV